MGLRTENKTLTNLSSLKRRSSPQSFPCDTLKESDSAICFFAAAFLGKQDAIHMAMAGIKNVVCVDTNVEKLEEMRAGPYAGLSGWTFRSDDAFIAAADLGIADVVSCDPFTGTTMRYVITKMAVFAALARKWLILGVTSAELNASNKLSPPPGFELNRMLKRSANYGGTYWAVFRRVSWPDPVAKHPPVDVDAYAPRSGVNYMDLITKLTEGTEIVPLRTLADPVGERKIVALRHDMCGHRSHPDALGIALEFARMEAANGISATYFPVPCAPYWNQARFGDAIQELVALGHEIGLHCEAVTHWVKEGETPEHWIRRDLAHLRQFAEVKGAAAHGDPLCYKKGARHSNYECWTEFDEVKGRSPRDLIVPKLRLSDVGLEYEAYLSSQHTHYLSDSGAKWRGGPKTRPVSFEDGWEEDLDWVVGNFRKAEHGSLQLLVHPVWWEMR